jgi:hypothetical protein
MKLELYCPCCDQQFIPGPKTPMAEAFRGLEEIGPWSALGDGETFEDLLYSTLTANPEIACPDCGGTATLGENTLGELSHQLLASW